LRVVARGLVVVAGRDEPGVQLEGPDVCGAAPRVACLLVLPVGIELLRGPLPRGCVVGGARVEARRVRAPGRAGGRRDTDVRDTRRARVAEGGGDVEGAGGGAGDGALAVCEQPLDLVGRVLGVALEE